jgi:hypothetical protein
MSTPATGVQEWRDIPWPKVERNVHKLQRRIFRASQRGDVRTVHRLVSFRQACMNLSGRCSRVTALLVFEEEPRWEQANVVSCPRT